MRVALGVALLLLSLPLRAQWALEASITGVAQRSDDHTARSARSASADAFVFYTADWGALLAHLEASTTPDTQGLTAAYPEANADAGSALDARGKGRIQLSELSYQSPRWQQQQLVLGLIDPSAWLDRSRITSDENLHFLNASFVNNPTIPFPNYTLGAVWQWREREGAPGLTVIATRARGLLDFERRAHRELFDDEQGGHGGFFGLGSGWRGGNWRLRYGGWLRVDNDIAREDPALSRSRQGAYAVAGYLADAVQLNLRLGFSEGRGGKCASLWPSLPSDPCALAWWARGWRAASTPRSPGHAVASATMPRSSCVCPCGRAAEHISPRRCNTCRVAPAAMP